MGYLFDRFQAADVRAFNAYRKEHPDIDLIDLSGVEVVGKDFSGIDLSGVVLFDGHFAKCVFKEADFSGAELRGAFFGECDLQDATFANANCQKARFIQCSMQGANFRIFSAVEAVFMGNAKEYLPAKTYLELPEFEPAFINPCIRVVSPIAVITKRRQPTPTVPGNRTLH